MEWWIIPKGNPMEVATTSGGMYRRAWKDLPEHTKSRQIYDMIAEALQNIRNQFKVMIEDRFFPALYMIKTSPVRTFLSSLVYSQRAFIIHILNAWASNEAMR